MRQTDRKTQEVSGVTKTSGKGSRLGERIQYPLRLPPEMHKAFCDLATDDGMTLHAYLIMVLADHLSKKKKENKNKG